MSKKITKREFIKYSLCSTCGALLGLSSLDLLASGAGKLFRAPAQGPPDLWKWSREAAYYIQTPRGMKCLICPTECSEISEVKYSTCRTRIASGNKLYTIAYGNPCAVNIDPIEKKPLYHFLPTTTALSIATAGCNLACLNCQNWTISQSSPKDTQNYDLMPDKVVEECINSKCRSIAYTYSDPVAYYEYAYDTAKLARAKGIKNVLVSAGYIYERPLRELCKYLDAATIDIKSFSEDIYAMLNGAKLKPVLEALKIMKQEGLWLEISNLVVPSWTDDIEMIKRMCDWFVENGFAGNPFHFLRFQPQYKLTNLPPTPASTLERVRNIALSAGMKFVYIGNVPGEGETTFCPKCKKTLVDRKGFQILANNIVNSKCKFCQEPIPGVWQ
jgi:pyruvate formate lyase activating enzyme